MPITNDPTKGFLADLYGEKPNEGGSTQSRREINPDPPRLELTRANFIYNHLFNDYDVPIKPGISKKDKRVQLLLYSELHAIATDTATMLNVSLNDLIAAALLKLLSDYEKQFE